MTSVFMTGRLRSGHGAECARGDAMLVAQLAGSIKMFTSSASTSPDLSLPFLVVGHASSSSSSKLKLSAAPSHWRS
eukprot:COSAG06_NODE_19201_length_849_cov_1.050667_2_plen_76_part_00